MLVFPFGRAAYVSKSQTWSDGVAKEVKEVEEIFSQSKFAYHACGNQEVYSIKEESIPLYDELKVKLKQAVMSQDKETYEMARHVTAW